MTWPQVADHAVSVAGILALCWMLLKASGALR